MAKTEEIAKANYYKRKISTFKSFISRKKKLFVDNPKQAFLQSATFLGVMGCVSAVLAAVHPSLILKNTTPTGGDMGAHVWWPAYMRDVLLKSGRLFGWSMDFYAGFPVGQYYFPVPAIMIAILDIVMPYNVAFKVVVVSGSVLLPVAAYTLGRALRAYRPIPMLMAFAATAFLFFQGDPRGNSPTTNTLLDIKGAIGNQRIMGGPLVSTMAGEFSFSIALCFALFFLAAFYTMLRDGKYRVTTGVLLALTIMSHLVVAIFVGLAAFVFWGAYYISQKGFTRVFGYAILSWIAVVSVSIGAIGRYFFDNKTQHLIYLVFLSSAVLVATFIYGFVKMREPAQKILKDILPIFSGLLMSCIWLLPLLDRFSYTSNMRYTKVDDVVTTQINELYELYIAPRYMFITVFVPVAIGFILSATLLRKHIIPLILTSTMMAAVFALWPEGHAWNLRFLPFWYLCIYFVAAIGVGEVLRLPSAIATYFAHKTSREETKTKNLQSVLLGVLILSLGLSEVLRRFTNYSILTFVLATILFFAVISAPFLYSQFAKKELSRNSLLALSNFLRVGLSVLMIVVFFAYLVGVGSKHFGADGKDDRAFRDRRGAGVDWSRYNFKGYEELPDYKEFKNLMNTMAKLPAGRALWETTQSGYGTTLALMLLPYYTDHRISSMEGLYFEASGTTAYHFLNVAEVSKQASNPMAWPKCVKNKEGINVDPTCIDQYYGNITDFNRGVSHMKLMGVRYYMAHTADAKELAKANKDLKLVATVKDELDTTDPSSGAAAVGTYSAPNGWEIYEVKGFNIVEPLAVDPIVVTDKSEPEDWVQSGNIWLYKWWNSYTQYPVFLDHGPKEFKHLNSDDALKDILSTKDQNKKSNVKVSKVKLKNDSISFDVDKIGQPVLVKVSYYPTFQVTGAKEIYRASPNFMLVVPTSKHVVIEMERDSIEWLSIFLFFVSIALFFFIYKNKFPNVKSRFMKKNQPQNELPSALDEDISN